MTTNDFIEIVKSYGFVFSSDLTEEMLGTAAAGLNDDCGTAYDGALVAHCVLTYQIAERLAKMVSGTFTNIDLNSLRKVCYLHQIAKAQMIIHNDNAWEVEKRGLTYKFAQLPGCLKVGERSVFLCMSAGVKFTAEEVEAMRVLDRDENDFKNIKFNLSIMSLIVKQANELAYAIEKEKKNK